MKKPLTVNLVDTLYFKKDNRFVTGGYGMEVFVQTNNITKRYGQNMLKSNIFQVGMYFEKGGKCYDDKRS